MRTTGPPPLPPPPALSLNTHPTTSTTHIAITTITTRTRIFSPHALTHMPFAARSSVAWDLRHGTAQHYELQSIIYGSILNIISNKHTLDAQMRARTEARPLRVDAQRS